MVCLLLEKRSTRRPLLAELRELVITIAHAQLAKGRAGARLRRARGHRGARRAEAAAASGDDVTIDGRADDQPKADRHAVVWDFRRKKI